VHASNSSTSLSFFIFFFDKNHSDHASYAPVFYILLHIVFYVVRITNKDNFDFQYVLHIMTHLNFSILKSEFLDTLSFSMSWQLHFWIGNFENFEKRS